MTQRAYYVLALEPTRRLIRSHRVVQEAMQVERPHAAERVEQSQAIFATFRKAWSAGWQCRSDLLFALAMSLTWLTFYNVRFWTDSVQAMWRGTFGSVVFFISLFVVTWLLQALLLLLLPSRRLMVGAASVGFVIAATSSYFVQKYGVVMNADMLRNVFETDPAEAQGLLSTDLIERVVMLGLVPAVLVWKTRLPPMRRSSRLRKRSFAILGSLVVCALALVSSSASYAVLFRAHKPIRFTLLPAAPVMSVFRVAFDKNKNTGGALIHASGAAQRTAAPQAKPLAIVLVVGETARAANFQLGGYSRPTNPELSAIDGLVYFPHTISCGTATAISVPCMFSHLARRQFDVDAAPRYANLLDALQDAGVHVEWRDNNAGCKGVCARVPTIEYRAQADPRRCPEPYCYDEIMLDGLANQLEGLQTDTVIVMHQIGSHGPAYGERYPPERETFKPACHSNELQRCTPEEVVNAYDNSIAYTDHVLARTIGMLSAAADRVDSMLLYVSDHGESLGEQGLYLHGLPYAFAPETQKHVPMLMWLSPTYVSRQGIVMPCVESRAATEFSHDNLYHTMLGATDVRNASYDRQLDILAPCRGYRPARYLPRNHE